MEKTLDKKIIENIEATELQFEMMRKCDEGITLMKERKEQYEQPLVKLTCEWAIGQLLMYDDKLKEANQVFTGALKNTITSLLTELTSRPSEEGNGELYHRLSGKLELGVGRVGYLGMEDAISHLTSAQMVAELTRDVPLEMDAHYWQARTFLRSDKERAKTLLEEVYKLAEENYGLKNVHEIEKLELAPGRILAWYNISMAVLNGLLNGDKYNIESAERYMGRIADIDGLAYLFNQKGDIFQAQGHNEQARECYEKGLDGYRSINYGRGIMNCLEASAGLYSKKETINMYVEALDIATKLGLEKRANGIQEKLSNYKSK